MGNTQSAPGQQAPPSNLLPDQAGNIIAAGTPPSQPVHTRPRQVSVSRRSAMYSAIHRRVSSRPALAPPTEGPERRSTSDEMDLDQDESPLVHEGIQATQEDTSMTASTQAINISRSLSTVSRLGSRFMPEAVRNTLWNSGEETEHEGDALRNGASARLRSPTPPPRQAQSQNIASPPSPFSLVSSLRRRIGQRSEGGSTDPRRRLPNGLRRVRLSLASPFAALMGHSTSRSGSRLSDRSSPTHTARSGFADDSDQLLPRLNTGDHGGDMDEPLHELDAVDAETGNGLAPPAVTTGMSTVRRFPPTLRSRSTRLIRRAEYPPLSQVLQLAAAAIAAQLSGHANAGASAGRPFAGDVFDGSIQNFVQTLQEAASAQAGENLDVNAPEGELPPVNFMRVFQFPNDDLGAPMPPTAPAPHHQAQQRSSPDESGQTPNAHDADRSVTLVLVGVRSMPAGADPGSSENGSIGPSLDNLLSLPFLPPQSNVLGPAASGALFRRHAQRTRPHSRRHSITNFSFPAQYESQRHQRRTPTSASATTITPPSESPPGPHPPPSTPADIRSGAATPIRRPSSASAVHPSALPDLDEDQVEAAAFSPPDLEFNVARQRRRSDSEFARRPELGSGASRRNGVVEPDTMSSSAGRSWLIYVVGTNVSPDHPAFTMPSLFTDNPSYEDMQMLSTLLGPVKPPVASRDDVASAGGTFRLVLHANGLVAEPVEADTGPVISIKAGERCLICLCDYAAAEEVRQLGKCRHVFHRECIDEALSVVDDRTKQLPDVPRPGRGRDEADG
ncbi:hypothetical protein DV735_g4552, partial [Chaetothyriales sp. CBS 134920]